MHRAASIEMIISGMALLAASLVLRQIAVDVETVIASWLGSVFVVVGTGKLLFLD